MPFSNQFHDVLPGSSIHEVYEDTDRIYAYVIASASALRNAALLRLLRVRFSSSLSSIRISRLRIFSPSAQVFPEGSAKAGGDSAVLVINTLSWPRTEVAELPASAANSFTQTSHDGKILGIFLFFA